MKPRPLIAVLIAVSGAACAAAGPPVVVVEEHHEAVAAWAAGGAPDALLLHFDAHEDLGEPDGSGELSPADVIVPALRSGAIREWVWVIPPWLAAPRGTRLLDLAAPAGDWILDFDLDFFASENPHAAHIDREITREEYEADLAGGTVRMRGEAREGDVVTESIVLARPPGPYTWPVRLDRVRDLATGKTRHLRGCICMGEYRDAFPVHRPSEAELEALLGQVRAVLAALPCPPVLVTIARSATSGFVPAARADAIEAGLLAILEDLWPAGRPPVADCAAGGSVR